MGLKLDIINPLAYPEWDKLLLSNEQYSFFHTSCWAKVLKESYDYDPLYFVLTDNAKTKVLIPFMKIKSSLTGLRGVSLPFSDYCEPIISNDILSQEVFSFLADYGEKSGWRYMELRGGNGFFKDACASSFFYGHTIDLSKDEERIFSSFRSSTKRNIKKASRMGVEINVSNSLDSLKEFYRLNCITKRLHGLPPQPFYFFKEIFEHILSKQQGILLLASFRGKTIAGAIYFFIGRKALFKYGASDKKYQHLRANNLVMWEAMKWCSRNGFKDFSLGRTEPENKGLRQFKTGWGGTERVINYFKYDLRKKGFIKDNPNISGIHNKIFRTIPSQLSCLIGKILYKHMG